MNQRGVSQYIGEIDTRLFNYEEDFAILLKEWEQTRTLLVEIVGGLEDERSPWYAVDIDPEIHELNRRVNFRIQTLLGTLGGQEPKEIVAFLRKCRDDR